MLIPSIIGGLASVGIGYFLKKAYENDYRYQITDREFAVTAALVFFVASPVTAFVGYQMAIAENVTYQENWSGWERKALKDVMQCTRDGSCKYEYDCDPYTVTVERDGEEVEETRYHQCPYLSEEWTFRLDTTAGEVLIADHWAPPNPQNYRYRAWVSVPGNIPSGIPQSWTESKQRIEAGTPGPVAVRHPYSNFILASQNTLLKSYSQEIEALQEQNLLPPLQYSVVGDYLLNRTYFVGVPNNSGDWFQASMRFNAVFGGELQGDLHLVLVDSSLSIDKNEYSNALIAYWQSEAFGKNALAKNTILVVAGVKDGTVEWARAATGMPSGNEALLIQIQNALPGTEVSPEAMLGVPQATLSGGQLNYTRPQGKLAQVLWGNHQFKRVCMKCEDAGEEDSPGFLYLLNEVTPSTGQYALIILGVVLVSGVFWYFVIRYDVL